MTKNTRLNPRVDTHLDASYQLGVDGPWVSATIKNLSAGGVALVTHGPLEPMTSVAGLRFDLPADHSKDRARRIEASAMVLHTQSSQGVDDCLNGLHFIDLDPQDLRALQEFVWSKRQSNDEPDKSS